MPPTSVSRSTTLTLEETIARLAGHDVVDGIAIVGSASQDAVTPASDYDLLVVLSELPAPIRIVLTSVDRRLTEVYVVSAETIERLLATDEPIPDDSDAGLLAGWLRAGRIAFDRAGRLDRAQRRARAAQSPTPASEGQIYLAWFKINYNLKQTQRILMSDDPVYLMTVDMRLLYSLAELWVNYFHFRRLPWRGEKESIRHLAAHDPAYLDILRRCLAETDRRRKVALYEWLAELTLAPLGGPWAGDVTAVQLQAGADTRPEAVEQALAFWDGLLTSR